MPQASLKIHALEINASMIGALFTDRSGDSLRVFCFYLNGDTGQFDVPEEANRDSLHNLFSKLDMVGYCTSFILEKVVRARIYVEQDGNLQSYTLLASPGDAPPPLNADICRLPWKVVWAGQEAEVLRLAGVGGRARCHAVRSKVRDVDAEALYRSSKAFINPQAIMQKSNNAGSALRQIAAVGLLAVAVGLGWLLGYSMRSATEVTKVAARSIEDRVAIAELKAQVLHNKTITGPFTLADLDQMKTDAKLPAEALFRLEGSAEWLRWNELPWDGQRSTTAAKAP